MKTLMICKPNMVGSASSRKKRTSRRYKDEHLFNNWRLTKTCVRVFASQINLEQSTMALSPMWRGALFGKAASIQVDWDHDLSQGDNVCVCFEILFARRFNQFPHTVAGNSFRGGPSRAFGMLAHSAVVGYWPPAGHRHNKTGTLGRPRTKLARGNDRRGGSDRGPARAVFSGA